MGNVINRKLHVKKVQGPRCWGTGLIAMDIVDLETSEFAAAGGSCGNLMAILSWFGWAATPVARFGDDPAGRHVRHEFDALQVDLSLISSEAKGETPIIIQRFVTDKNGRRTHRFSLSCPECGAWLPRHRPITLHQAKSLAESKQRPKAYYFDRVSPGALWLAETAREKGALVVFEPASVGDEIKFLRAVDLCHVLKYSHDRLGYLPDLAISKSPKLIIETQGQDGLQFRWRNRWAHLNAIELDNPIDAAGSGDWCTAALIHCIGQNGRVGLNKLRKDELVAALQTGQALASINCQYYGARGAMMVLTLRDINRRLEYLTGRADYYSDQTTMPAGIEPPAFCRRCDTGECVDAAKGDYQKSIS